MFRKIMQLALFCFVVMTMAIATSRDIVSQQAANPSVEVPAKITWKPVGNHDLKQVRKTFWEVSKPRPLKIYVAQISVSKELQVVVTPDNGKENLETNGLKTTSFLDKHQCDVAINASPFAPVHLLENRQHDIRGLQIAKGTIVSKPDPQTPVLIFDAANRPSIHKMPPKSLKGVANAVAGFHIALEKGKPKGDNKTLHPRTAVGIDKNQKWITLLVVDGRQKGKSEGATVFEIGSILKQLGCEQGINLDGGGTSTLVTRDAKKIVVENVPIHAGVPGLERPSASHLGFKIKSKSAKIQSSR